MSIQRYEVAAIAVVDTWPPRWEAGLRSNINGDVVEHADHAAALAAKEREWWVRLGKFRKALDAAGLHGHYNLLQEHFQDESGKWEAQEREIERLTAQVERAEKSCSQLADGVVRYKAQAEQLSRPFSEAEVKEKWPEASLAEAGLANAMTLARIGLRAWTKDSIALTVAIDAARAAEKP